MSKKAVNKNMWEWAFDLFNSINFATIPHDKTSEIIRNLATYVQQHLKTVKVPEYELRESNIPDSILTIINKIDYKSISAMKEGIIKMFLHQYIGKL